MQNQQLAQQAELAAKILKDGLPWQTQFQDSTEWYEAHDRSDPIVAISRGATIRIKPTPTLIPLEASDIPPGSVIRSSVWPEGTWEYITGIELSGIRFSGNTLHLFEGELVDHQINRSIPLLGKWDPTAWEPCSKPSTN